MPKSACNSANRIGTFQAVAHLCASTPPSERVPVDRPGGVGRQSLWRDAWADAELAGPPLPRCSRDSGSAFLAGTNNIQVHGGMGLHPRNRRITCFLKRSVLLKRLLPGVVAAEAALALRREED